MKRRSSLVKIVLLILAILVVPTANAADSGPAGTFQASLILSNYPGLSHDVMWDCRGHADRKCHQKYNLHKYTLRYNGQDYPAYCIYPNAYARGVNTVTCSPLQREYMPMVYYLIDQHYSELMSNPVVADLVFRITGSFEKYNGGAVDLGNITRDKQRQGEAMFTTTMQARVLNVPFTDGGFYGFVLHNNGAYTDDGNGTYWEPGTVQQAVDLINEAMAAVQGGYNGSGATNITNQDNVGVGAKFTVTPMPETAGEDGSMTFKIESIGGAPYNNIKITATRGKIVSYTWNLTSGTVRVAPLNNDCRAQITICPDATGNPPSGTPPTGTPPSTTPCPCKVPYTKSEYKDWEYPCIEWGPWYDTEKSRARNCIKRDKSQAPKYHINYKCLSSQSECSSYMSQYRGEGSLKVVSTTNDNDDTLDVEYETEHELVFDNGVAYNNENSVEDNTVQLAEGGESSQSAVFLCTISGNVNEQSYIAITNNGVMCETFDLPLSCDDCYKGNCEPTGKKDEFKDQEVHNCCEEGARSYGRQYALNELFCDYSKGGKHIPYFAVRCNADEYKDSTPINNYCEQYCSSSFYYELPGPSHSKQDRYFYWSKKDGSAGPILNQYRRCRTLIKYDEWYKAYTTNVEAAIDFYNGAQKNYAYYNMWKDMIAANSTKSFPEKQTITCTTNWSWTYSCSESCTKGTTDCTCTTTNNVETCTKPSSCNDSGTTSASADVAAYTIHYYDTNAYHNSSSYTYGVLERYGDETAGNYSYSKIKLKSKANPTDTTLYYNKSEAEKYFSDKWNPTKSSVETSSKSKTSNPSKTIPSNATQGTTSCTAAPTIPNQVDPVSKRDGYLSSANSLTGSHDGSVAEVDGLKLALNTCGGTVANDAPADDSKIVERVKFGREPDMEFSYAAKYVGFDGKENDQEIAIPFYKVDSAGNRINKCIENPESGFMVIPSKGNDGGTKSDSEYVDGSIFYGNYYDEGKYSGVVHAKLYDMKAIGTGKLDSVSGVTSGSEWYASYKNEVYYADKKFTTDAISHMTCRWSDTETGPKYTIVPNGIVVEEDVVGTLCSMDNYNCINYKDRYGNDISNDGLYHTYKGHIQGKFETYFTLFDICVEHESDEKGIFDDMIHEQGLPCSGQKDLVTSSGKKVNATCYIEIKKEFQSLYNCSGQGVLSLDDAASTICCNGSTDWTNCGGASVLYDYRVVDPEDMFKDTDYVNSVGGGFAHNWVVDPDGQEQLKRMHQLGETDSTYAPENLTYSFTLTPRDLREIREYNKTRVNEGGYNDFNMKCEQSTNRKVLQKCQSRFLDAISGGNALSSGSMTLELQTNNTSLVEARNKVWKVE